MISKEDYYKNATPQEIFIEELIDFSLLALDIPINRTKRERLIFIDSEENLQPEFMDKNSGLLQYAILEANEKQINLILSNFTNAINTNCGNDIDLNKISIPEYYDYSTISKKVWLKLFVQDLKQVKQAVKYISDSIYKRPPQPKADDSLPETLSDLITHEKSAEIVEDIKKKYKNIKGKRLKLLLLALQELELMPKERIASKFHACCKQEFDWNIASYNAMNGYNFNERTDVDEFQNMTSFLKELKNTE